MQRFSDLWCVATKVVTSLGFHKYMWDSYPHERRIMRSANVVVTRGERRTEHGGIVKGGAPVRSVWGSDALSGRGLVLDVLL